MKGKIERSAHRERRALFNDRDIATQFVLVPVNCQWFAFVRGIGQRAETTSRDFGHSLSGLCSHLTVYFTLVHNDLLEGRE